MKTHEKLITHFFEFIGFMIFKIIDNIDNEIKGLKEKNKDLEKENQELKQTVQEIKVDLEAKNNIMAENDMLH